MQTSKLIQPSNWERKRIRLESYLLKNGGVHIIDYMDEGESIILQLGDSEYELTRHKNKIHVRILR